ncbi:MAG: leucine-rich repeat domain-containing protein [Treponema sp.]|jgi:hypothetical protein|nr:leucine-rich repeat domain-containing protein [Treponema sp.]
MKNDVSDSGDFSYGLNDAGNGIVIRRYSGGGVVVIPSVIGDLPVVEIGERAFGGSRITSVVIPGGVTAAGWGAFSGCGSLTTVWFPDTVETIGMYAFSGAASLHTVNLPAGLKRIGFEAFGGAGGLYNLAIPGGLTAVKWTDLGGDGENPGNHAFEGCGRLGPETRRRLRDLGYTGEF